VDPAAIAAEGVDYRYLHALVTPGADETACAVAGIAFLETMYPGNSIPSVHST
jgi:hypothetical protein